MTGSLMSPASPRTVRFDAPSRSSRSSVRLTARGRALVLLTLVTLLLCAFVLGRSGTSDAASEASPSVPYAQTTVHSGETLWSVAKRVAPGRDPRAVIEQLQALNHLSSSAVQVGQQLLLPHAS